jgi:MSHA pilin protein MshC
MELVMTMVIVGILAVVALPRLTRTAFDEARLYQETLAALRYAQRTALAHQRTVCATFSGTPTKQLTLTYASSCVYPSACTVSDCNANLPAPAGVSTGAYTVAAAGSASYTTASSFAFDRVGRPSAAQTIVLSDGRTIAVEPETGYVH